MTIGNPAPHLFPVVHPTETLRFHHLRPLRTHVVLLVAVFKGVNLGQSLAFSVLSV
jgi:hypothetical protein